MGVEKGDGRERGEETRRDGDFGHEGARAVRGKTGEGAKDLWMRQDEEKGD